MGKIYILDHSGDTELKWDIANEQATQVAREKFAELTRSGHLMTEVVEGHGQSQVRSFNPAAEEIVAIPRLQGG